MTKPAVPYSDEVAAIICERLAAGESLAKIGGDEGMPARSTINQWLGVNPVFQTMYRAAKEEQADAEFDRLDELVNEKPPTDDKGKVDMGWVQNQRLKVDALKWKLARMSPRKYSERLEVTGADGEAFIPPVQALTDHQLLEGAKRIAFMLRRADMLQSSHQAEPLQLLPDENGDTAVAPSRQGSSMWP